MIPVELISNLGVADLPARASEVGNGIELLAGQSRYLECFNFNNKLCGRFPTFIKSNIGEKESFCLSRRPICCREVPFGLARLLGGNKGRCTVRGGR